jgi:hypothetical protein
MGLRVLAARIEDKKFSCFAMLEALSHSLKHALMTTGFVFVMMLVIESPKILSQGV